MKKKDERRSTNSSGYSHWPISFGSNPNAPDDGKNKIGPHITRRIRSDIQIALRTARNLFAVLFCFSAFSASRWGENIFSWAGGKKSQNKIFPARLDVIKLFRLFAYPIEKDGGAKIQNSKAKPNKDVRRPWSEYSSTLSLATDWIKTQIRCKLSKAFRKKGFSSPPRTMIHRIASWSAFDHYHLESLSKKNSHLRQQMLKFSRFPSRACCASDLWFLLIFAAAGWSIQFASAKFNLRDWRW